MTTAKCLKCGLVIKGVFRKGPPAACPACGFSGSQGVLDQMKAQREAQAAYLKKGKWGRLWYQLCLFVKNKFKWCIAPKKVSDAIR